MLRKMFIPKREEVTAGLRNLLNKELNKLYASPNVRVIK